MKNIIKARFQLEIDNMKLKCDCLTRSIEYYKRRCEILEIILSDIDKNLLPPKGCSSQENFFKSYQENKSKTIIQADDQHITFAEDFFHESLCNQSKSQNGRRWSNRFIMLCYVLMNISPKCYDYMSHFFTIPYKLTLLNHYRKSVEIWKKYLLNIKEIPNICNWFWKEYSLENNYCLDVVLGIDAMSMEPLEVDIHGASKGDNSTFLFHILPLRPKFKSFPIHLCPFSKSNADNVIKSKIFQIKKELREQNVNVKYIATDSDPGYYIYHSELIEKWFPVFCQKGIDAAIDVYEKQDNLFISDFLHLLKNARSRIINCIVSISPDGSAAFNANDLNSVLNIGMSLTDLSSTGKMKDLYPLQIFTIENYIKLINCRKFNMAFFILPYALWNNAIRNPGMSAQMRLDFLTCCIDIFSYHKINLQHLNQGVTQNRKKGAVQYFCSQKHVNRALNTLIALIYEIRSYPDDIALERLGTHVLECQFGLIRMLCHYKHNWNMILKAFSKIMIINDITNTLGIPIVIKSRENIGGVKLNGINDTIYIQHPNIPTRQLIETLTALTQDPLFISSGVYDEMHQDVFCFTDWLIKFLHECRNKNIKIAKIWKGSAISNCTITARLISFGKIEHNDTVISNRIIDNMNGENYNYRQNEEEFQ